MQRAIFKNKSIIKASIYREFFILRNYYLTITQRQGGGLFSRLIHLPGKSGVPITGRRHWSRRIPENSPAIHGWVPAHGHPSKSGRDERSSIQRRAAALIRAMLAPVLSINAFTASRVNLEPRNKNRRMKIQFKTFMRWIFFGCNFGLIFSVLLPGCAPLRSQQLTPEQIGEDRRQLEIQKRAGVAKEVIARDAAADATMLDLSPFYDMELPGLPSEKDTPFRFLKPGTHIWDEIKFDVRGMIDPGFRDWDEVEFDHHHGTDGPGWQCEMKTNAFPVGRKCSEIDFLHGAFGNAGEPSKTISQFVVHFTNGHNETIPIIFGADVFSSEFNDNVITASGAAVPANAVEWESRLVKNAPSQPVFGFYIKKWINPFPDATVETIEFEPKLTGFRANGSAFLVAITIQPTINNTNELNAQPQRTK